MTNTYLTGNPLGSTAVKDLYDNASNFDEGLNSPAPSFVDRLLKRRQTWAGFEEAVATALIQLGYVFVTPLDYQAGTVLTAPNQIFRKDGEYYRAGPDIEFPYTLTGVWAIEGPLFVSVGDAALRSQLAASTGAELIGYGSSTVKQALDDLKSSEFFNVVTYGAVGDGVTDCTVAFQQAADAAGYGGTVYIPRGRYFLSDTVTLRGATKLIGTGIGSTYIVRTGDYGDTFECGSIADQSEPARSFECKFIEFTHGTNFSYGDTTLDHLATTGAHLRLRGCQEALLEGCWFHRLQYNVAFEGGSWVKIINCQFLGVYDPDRPALQETVGQLVASPSTVHGNPTTWIVKGCNFLGATVLRDVVYYPSSGARVINRIDTIGAQYGFLLQGLEDLDLSGNYFGGQSVAELAVLNSTGGAVIDYRVRGNFFDGCSRGYGILMAPAAASTASLGGIIESNFFVDNLHAIFVNRNAVSATPGAYNLQIRGNTSFSGIGSQFKLGGLVGGRVSENMITDYNKHNVTDSDADFASAIIVFDIADGFAVQNNSMGGGGNTLLNDIAFNFCYFGVVRSGSYVTVGKNYYFGIRTGVNFKVGYVESENIFIHTSTANYQMIASDEVYVRNSSGSGPSTVYLPIHPMAGSVKTVSDGKGDASTSALTIATTDGSLVNGGATIVLSTNWASATFRYTGTAWIRIA